MVKIENDFVSISEGEKDGAAGRVYVVLKKDPNGPQVMGMSQREFWMLLEAGRLFFEMKHEQERGEHFAVGG